VKTLDPDLAAFHWQEGYGLFRVSLSHVQELQEYILNQVDHLQTESFPEKYLRLLKKRYIAYDPRYLWDGMSKWSAPPGRRIQEQIPVALPPSTMAQPFGLNCLSPHYAQPQGPHNSETRLESAFGSVLGAGTSSPLSI